MGLAAVVAAALPAPWLAWNKAQYGTLTAARESEEILAPLLGHQAFGPDAVRAALAVTRRSLWRFQAAVSGRSQYETYWEVVVVSLTASAAIAALARRNRSALAWVAWLAVAPAAAFVTVLLLDHLGASGRSGVVGRHLAGAVPLVAVAAGAGAASFGSRFGPVVLAGLVSGALVLEAGGVAHYWR
ncbi:MAG: hypothetical protein C4344_04640, partial [Acidimicrobiia bacterium]